MYSESNGYARQGSDEKWIEKGRPWGTENLVSLRGLDGLKGQKKSNICLIA